MSLVLSDQAVIEKVLQHVADKTTDEAEDVWREPVANYLSEQRFLAEREQVMWRWPTVFCPASALAEPGSYLAREAAGTPIVAVRDKAGEVRAFKNACRHRGMQVAEGSGRGGALVCPYHGWTYQLDGSLSHVPHEAGFPGLGKSCHGLVPVEVREQHGLIYVVQAPTPGCWDALDLIPQIIGDDQQVFEETEYIVEANWKIFTEGFIEGYHIKPTHKETFFPYGYDNLNLVETFGHNSRITYPFRRIEKLADVPPEQWKVDGKLTYVYHLFPNVLVTVLSHFTTVIILEPVAIDKTLTRTWVFTNRGKLDSEQAIQDAKRDAEFVNNTGAKEDQAVVEAIQRSINSGANDHFTFGKFEKLIAHLHRGLKAQLKGVQIS
ncbi:MAG: Rieske 2Fe-2S domain-containing protein [Gammaproteobacteria bacterium]|nr:Rieske 2Fe-2S domain-containing protein [Gammaproteobacteria bacterium]